MRYCDIEELLISECYRRLFEHHGWIVCAQCRQTESVLRVLQQITNELLSGRCVDILRIIERKDGSVDWVAPRILDGKQAELLIQGGSSRLPARYTCRWLRRCERRGCVAHDDGATRLRY